ncbi:hypothetical protein KM622_gp048 [Spodoptera exempta nucleopolyhedrovirus]|uniref:Uncharacterized protein n=1 Tax=Spodoptera exempta nucleopolyhedrovirus TaxID=1242863 RepID=A0A410S7N9_9ABAC|nr:hypothetical protein KM622_gp048 [Spodoptera exempta nucleopolyhedrovirus]QAT90334.1 hypothetical protein [Spodoptera exempta nucleopolyhedrovirus]
MLFSSIALRRACNSVTCLSVREKLNSVIDFQDDNAQRLFENLLLNFDIGTVYVVVEECKRIVWALVRTVYARNVNLPSLKKNRHLNFVQNIVGDKLDCKLKCLARDLYRHHYMYELSEDSLSWDEFIQLLCNIDSLWK